MNLGYKGQNGLNHFICVNRIGKVLEKSGRAFVYSSKILKLLELNPSFGHAYFRIYPFRFRIAIRPPFFIITPFEQVLSNKTWGYPFAGNTGPGN